MGAILGTVTGGLLGGGGGGGYTNNPGTAVQPYTQAQLDAALNQSQNALQQQQGLASNLSAAGLQGGMTQQNVLAQQQALASALGQNATNQQGLQNQQNVFGQQQGLANQLQNQAMGQGPNPAQAQFGQNLSAATQQAAGTIASQKGISPALAAELVARQQGAAGQNAAGGAAVLQAQQQLAAQQQLQQQQAALQGAAQGQIGAQQTAAGQTAAIQNAMQGVGAQQQAQALQGVTAATQAAQQQQQGLQGGQNQITLGNLGGQNQAMGLNAAANQAATDRSSSLLGGILGAGAAKAGIPTGAKGGLVKKNEIKPPHGSNKKIKLEPHLQAISDIYHKNKMAEGGEMADTAPTPAGTENPEFLKEFVKGMGGQSDEKKATGGYASYQKGALVPGKAKVDHNSYSNDTVKAMLSPGEVVIPLDVMNSSDPASGAAKFVAALMAKKGKDSGKDKEDFHTALKSAISKRKGKSNVTQ